MDRLINRCLLVALNKQHRCVLIIREYTSAMVVLCVFCYILKSSFFKTSLPKLRRRQTWQNLPTSRRSRLARKCLLFQKVNSKSMSISFRLADDLDSREGGDKGGRDINQNCFSYGDSPLPSKITPACHLRVVAKVYNNPRCIRFLRHRWYEEGVVCVYEGFIRHYLV